MTQSVPITVRVPNRLHWDCGSCGDCCRNFVLGPVDPSVIEQLKRADIESLWPLAKSNGWFESVADAKGQIKYFLKPADHGGCVFLQDDNLCSIHAQLGSEYKPSFCREYPYHGVLSHNVLTITARPDCSNFHESFDTGTPIDACVDTFVSLKRPYGLAQSNHHQIQLIPGVAISTANWTGLEADILETLTPSARTPEQSNHLIRALIQEEVGGTWPQSQPDRARQISEALVHMLINALTQGLAQPTDDTPNTRKMRAILTQSLDTLKQVQSLRDQPVVDMTPRAQSYLDIILRSQIMSRTALSYGPLSAGLGLHLFASTVVRRAASSPNRSVLDAKDLGVHYAPFARFLLNGVVQRLMMQASDALTELFLTTPPDRHPQ